MKPPEFLVFEDADEIFCLMEKRWREIASVAIEKRGRFAAALSGGKTPLGFYSYLAAIKGLPWDKTNIFLVDERFVPPESEDSNYRMLGEALLRRIPIPFQNIHVISTREPSPLDSAKRYEEELRNFFNLLEGAFPEFDLILLGMGEDGHTASLFPDSDALRERNHLAVPVKSAASLLERITLTLPVINNAENVIFLVIGKSKTGVIKRLIDKKDASLPASMVKPKGRLLFVLDSEARGVEH